jgi:hypothetical protein
MHSLEQRDGGASEERIATVAAWQASPYFTRP